MNICIVGDGLTSLSLAKNLINKKIFVDVYQNRKYSKFTSNRTIGISKNNLDFFINEILKFSEKNTWEIKKIEIYLEKLKNDKVLNFTNASNNLFYMIKNDFLYKLLSNKLLKSKYFNKKIIKYDNFFQRLLSGKKYDLIINCNSNNFFSKKFFSKKINKDYNNIAYTAIFEHKKIVNKTAVQVFTKFGPIAYLPISNTETSVVCSLEIRNKGFSNNKILDLIKNNNPKFEIKKISKINSFNLKSSNLRNYHYKNILAFGDALHRIHPLAGQGFNMTIRDIKSLSEIIQNRIDLGMNLDATILEEFEKKIKHKNFIFSTGIDFIYEFFNFEKKIKSKNLSKALKFFGKNEKLNNIFISLANKGLNI